MRGLVWRMGSDPCGVGLNLNLISRADLANGVSRFALKANVGWETGVYDTRPSLETIPKGKLRRVQNALPTGNTTGPGNRPHQVPQITVQGATEERDARSEKCRAKGDRKAIFVRPHSAPDGALCPLTRGMVEQDDKPPARFRQRGSRCARYSLPPFSHAAPRAASASTSGPLRPGISSLIL